MFRRAAALKLVKIFRKPDLFWIILLGIGISLHFTTIRLYMSLYYTESCF